MITIKFSKENIKTLELALQQYYQFSRNKCNWIDSQSKKTWDKELEYISDVQDIISNKKGWKELQEINKNPKVMKKILLQDLKTLENSINQIKINLEQFKI